MTSETTKEDQTDETQVELSEAAKRQIQAANAGMSLREYETVLRHIGADY